MPRTRRHKSRTGIYHVVFRTVNRQQLFEDKEDYDHFLFLLNKYRSISGYELYAYCLMPNHIHLLMKEGDEGLGLTFRRIGASFVYWYNTKYDRVGHLFQDRFWSEAVEDESYFLTVLRYIHRNPVKAGLCSIPEGYKYSSYANYEKDKLIESSLAFAIIGQEEFKRYNHIENEDQCLDINEQDGKRLSDTKAQEIMKTRFKIANPADYQKAGKQVQDELLRILRKEGGSIRQISRLTGETIGRVRKYH